MSKFTSPLEGVRVAAPCPADWEKIVGDERVRYCGQCSLHVYNLSGMTKSEAEGLVANAEGRLCIRYYARADGSVLTRNCPVGLRALKQRVSRIASATLSAVIGFFAGLGLNFGLTPTPTHRVMGEMAAPVRLKRATPYQPPPPPLPVIVDVPYGPVVQGSMAAPPRTMMGKMRPMDKDKDESAPASKRPKYRRRL